MAKIGVFGGTFNPPHRGHVQAAREVKEALGLDRVLFIPDAQPPHKEVPEGSPGPEVRLNMVEAAVQGESYAHVSDLELRRAGKSYTSDTLRALKAEYPHDTLYLIMGTDMFLSFHTWHEPEVIAQLAVLAALDREESDRSGEMQQQKAYLEQAFGTKVELVKNRVLEISSTKVRRLLILGGAEKYVPQSVLDIIYAQGLYGAGKSYRNLSVEELRQVSTDLLKKKRVAHVLGCAETAVKLARHYGADETVALRAGLLHDVTKAIDGVDQLLLVDKYDILISDFERTHPKVLHAKTGAAVAEHVFGESPEVVEAIYWHTTGRANMSLMEKIIYLADYIEPTRTFEGVEELRTMAMEDLDKTLLKSFDMVLEELMRENKRICRETPEARDYIYAQIHGVNS